MTTIETNEPVPCQKREQNSAMTVRHYGKSSFFSQALRGINKNILRDGMIILLAQFVLLAGLLLAGKELILDPIMQTFLLIYASYAGWSMFEKERQEGALEYMLSLPVSRSRLFFVKFVPRVAVSLIVLAFYLLLHRLFEFPLIQDELSFSITYAVFFLISLAFSISIKSFITVFLLASLLSFGQAFYIKMFDRTLTEAESLLRANLALIVFPLLFFFLFRYYDIKPISFFNRKFAPPAFLLTIIILAAGYFTTAETWNFYILSESGSVIRCKCKKTEILQKQEKKMKRFKYGGCVFPLYEMAQLNRLYAVKRTPDPSGCLINSLISVDLKNGVEHVLGDIPENWDLAGLFPGKIGKCLDGTYYVLLQSYERQLQMIMAITGEKVKQIPVSGNLNNRYITEFFYASPSQRQFFVIDKSDIVFRIDESGAAEELFHAEALASWKDRLLVFEETGMTLYKIDETGKDTLIPELTTLYRKQGKIRKIMRHWGTHETRLVIFKDDRDYFMLDLEKDGALEKLEIKFPPFYYLVHENKYFLLYRQPQQIIISQIENGKVIKEERWQPQVEFDYDQIYVSLYGILVYNQKEYEVYPFKK